MSDNSKGQASCSRADVAKVVLALLAMLAVMIGSIYYPFPTGPLDVTGFVKIWLREIITLGFAVVALVFVGGVWLLQLIKKRRERRRNVP